MRKQYAHLYAMAKTSVKFQNDFLKTVGGVKLTSQLLMNGRVTARLYRTCVLTQVRQKNIIWSSNKRKQTFWHELSINTQISLHSHTVWSESSLSIRRIFAVLAIHNMSSKRSDQTANAQWSESLPGTMLESTFFWLSDIVDHILLNTVYLESWLISNKTTFSTASYTLRYRF